MTPHRLPEKTVVVTGGASGIGEEICRTFADAGASIVIADVDVDGATALADELATAGNTAVPFDVDVTDYSQVTALTEAAQARFGGIDVLITSAGISKFGPIEELQVEWWQRVIDVNLHGVFNACHAAAKVMMAQRRGKIITISSLAGLTAIPNQAPYVASKHAVVGLTKALAIDLGPYGINVNCICPATTLTPLAQKTRSQEFIEAESHRTPLDRMATPKDHADAALFLASPESDYLTGVILPVDGGRLIAMRAHDE